MKTPPQYTIRNMPEQVDRYLRQRAKQTGQSLNQTIIAELSERAGVTKDGKQQSLSESLSWFIGSGFDTEADKKLAIEDKNQKQLAKRELRKS
jgi:hypothetical protein